MSKFIIECPHCGKYAEGRTGFFARKKIDCACGYTIDVRTDKLTGRECPHCGNMVVFDQTKGEKAKCPVCGEPINDLAAQDKTLEFSCQQCGVRLRTGKSAEKYTCPVCDFENFIPERLMSEKIKKDGLASIIKYEGDNDTLIWKHPIEDFNYGSQLIVHESQEAIFFRDGQAFDLFGPGRYTLETQQLPLLALFASMLFDGGVRIGQATPKVWAIILYLALACTLTGYLLQNLALEKIPARAVSLIQCTCPVMTAVFSFLLLGERLAAVGMIGAVIILFCVAGESVFGWKP